MSEAWFVYLGSGRSGFTLTSKKESVRCVRSPNEQLGAGSRYAVSGGVVQDRGTTLEWQQTPPPIQYALGDAKTYCDGLGATLGGTAWRLPTVKELLTIVDLTVISPTIDGTIFPSTLPVHFWAASPVAGSPTDGWYVDFDTGESYTEASVTMNSVRCVR